MTTSVSSLRRLLVAATLVLTSCSSDDGATIIDGTPTPPTVETSETATTTTAPTTTAPTTTAPTTTGIAPTATVDSAYPPRDCVGVDWKTFDAGDFSFRLPPDVVDQEVQGIDSLVGRFVGDGLDVFFDYGFFSADLGDLERLGATIEAITVGSRDGRTTTADGRGSGYETDLVTALFVPELGVVGIPSTDLRMQIGYDDAGLTPTAECIVASVRFR